MVAGAGMQAMSAYQSARNERAGYAYQAQVADNNAQIAEWQAKDSIQRGQTEEQNQRLKTASTYGSQRAALAANGVVLSEGSALDVLTTTKYLGERDALTVRDNALKEAWGYKNQAAASRADAAAMRWKRSTISPLMNTTTSLLTSASSISDKWSKAKTEGVSSNSFWWGRS